MSQKHNPFWRYSWEDGLDAASRMLEQAVTSQFPCNFALLPWCHIVVKNRLEIFIAYILRFVLSVFFATILFFLLATLGSYVILDYLS